MSNICNKDLGAAVIGGISMPITCGKTSGHDTAPNSNDDAKAHGDPVYGATLPAVTTGRRLGAWNQPGR